MTGDKAWNELLDLDKNVTLEQLEAKGYINVTGCLDAVSYTHLDVYKRQYIWKADRFSEALHRQF